MAAGIQRVNPGHVGFKALVDAGATLEEFLAYTQKARDKSEPFSYLVTTLTNERQRAAEATQSMVRGAMPQPAAKNAAAARGMSMAILTGAVPPAASTTTLETIDVPARILPA